MNTEGKKISVIGLGYIGLPTAAMIAATARHVIGVDINAEIVAMINAGETHIVEPALNQLVRKVTTEGYLRAMTSPQTADVFLITVPTPFQQHYEPDLSYVEAAAASIAPVLKKGDLIILESTSPVGTTARLSEQLATLRNDLIFPHQSSENVDIHIAYCPERVMPGKIMQELIANDRIIGGMTAACAEKARDFYKLFVKGNCILTNCQTAEMTKLTENAFRDVNIAFANELSMICDRLNINVWELIQLANHHPRVNILQPGPGVGGHCIAVDPWFIVHAAPEEAKLIRAAREVNDAKPTFVVQKIKAAATKILKPVIACLGLTYKADTNDVRESPAVEVVRQLFLDIAHYPLLIVEPHIHTLPNHIKANERIQLVTLEKALSAANIIVLMVNHKEFHFLNDMQLKQKIFINMVSDKQLKISSADAELIEYDELIAV